MATIDNLIKRADTTSPITSEQHDANLEAIATAIDQNVPNGVSSSPQELSENGGTVVWNITEGSNASIVLEDDLELEIEEADAGDYGTLVVHQDADGERMLTLPGTSRVIGGGGGVINLTPTPNAVDIITFYYDGAHFYWSAGFNYTGQ